MRPKLFKDIIFDLDGTLIDSFADVRTAVNSLLNEEGRRPLLDSEVRSLIGKGVEPLLLGAFSFSGGLASESSLEDITQRYYQHYLDIEHDPKIIFPGVLPALRQFTESGVRMAICTNKPKLLTHSVLQSLKIIPYFDTVVCPEDTTHRKPHAAHIQTTLERMGATKAQSLYVGDSYIDAAAAYNAGIECILVTHGLAVSDFPPFIPKLIINNFQELRPIVLT